MAVYYIDRLNGNDDYDGSTPERAKRTYENLEVGKGDEVLFKRGSFYRDMLHAKKFVSYGAYGEGELPTFCGSTDVSLPEDWAATETENVWKCRKPIPGDVGNFVFNGGDCSASFRWAKSELSSQGDFYDGKTVEGDRAKDVSEESELYLYSVGNPASVYSHVEAVSYGKRRLVRLGDGMSFENLRFINSGVHGMQGTASNVSVRGCVFENIGGCYWDRKLKIRFGNGFEIWERGNDILIENCVFRNIYDSCVTHQGPGDKTVPAENFICRNCTFDTYGMAAFEYRDKLPVNSRFSDNICLNAGCGFAMLGEELPRNSEIWPQPMGHHIFLWRIDEPTEGGKLTIENNFFGAAPVGAAIYSIVSPKAEGQIALVNNRYTENGKLTVRWGGKNYSGSEEFRRETGQEQNNERR